MCAKSTPTWSKGGRGKRDIAGAVIAHDLTRIILQEIYLMLSRRILQPPTSTTRSVPNGGAQYEPHTTTHPQMGGLFAPWDSIRRGHLHWGFCVLDRDTDKGNPHLPTRPELLLPHYRVENNHFRRVRKYMCSMSMVPVRDTCMVSA